MADSVASDLEQLLCDIRACQHCRGKIPEPRPVLRAEHSARVLLVGQAPGTRVHASGVPWDDASGKRLRHWMGIDSARFYDASQIAIVPMGLCYPGKGKSGDLPPRPECAPKWHGPLLELLPNIECTLLIGSYAQQHYLQDDYKTLTERVRQWREFAPACFVMPHPSPRNTLWLKRNPWFEDEVVPALRSRLRSLLDLPGRGAKNGFDLPTEPP